MRLELAGDVQPVALRCLQQAGARQPDDGQRRVVVEDGVHDGPGVVTVGARGFEEGAARTDAADPGLLCEGETVEGAQLVDDRCGQIVGVVVNEPFPATDAVGVADGSADRDPPGHGLAAGAEHRCRFTGVHATGHESRAQQRPQAAVGLRGSLAQTMPHFGCQVDVHVWGIYSLVPTRDAES